MMQSYQVCVSVIFWVSLLSEIGLHKKYLTWTLLKKKKKKKHAATHTQHVQSTTTSSNDL